MFYLVITFFLALGAYFYFTRDLPTPAENLSAADLPTGREDTFVVDASMNGQTIHRPSEVVVIPASLVFAAEIEARGVVIDGPFDGKITAEWVEVGSEAIVDGSVNAPRIVVADGGLLRAQVLWLGSEPSQD